MTRDQAIQIIENTYPADSADCHTAKTGRRLLERAKENAENWRNLPDHILLQYANLCREEVWHAEQNAARNAAYYR